MPKLWEESRNLQVLHWPYPKRTVPLSGDDSWGRFHKSDLVLGTSSSQSLDTRTFAFRFVYKYTHELRVHALKRTTCCNIVQNSIVLPTFVNHIVQCIQLLKIPENTSSWEICQALCKNTAGV